MQIANIFILSSFILLIKYEKIKRTHYLLFHLLFFTLALFSKEVALIAPLMFIIYLTKFKIQSWHFTVR